MFKEQFADISRVCFLELARTEKTFEGRTLNFFDPVTNRQLNYNITITDSKTGFLVCIPIPRKALQFLEKEDLKTIMFKSMEQLVAALKLYKEKPTDKPTDYTAIHLRAGRKSSMLDKIEKLNNGTTINIFRWSKIILPLRTVDDIDTDQQQFIDPEETGETRA